MTYSKYLAAFGAGMITLLGACTPAPEPVTQVIYAQPTFDKFGNPSCRPGNVAVGETYSADLPLCDIISGVPVAQTMTEMDDGTGTVVVDPDDPIDPDDPNGGNQNQNQNENRNRNNNG